MKNTIINEGTQEIIPVNKFIPYQRGYTGILKRKQKKNFSTIKNSYTFHFFQLRIYKFNENSFQITTSKHQSISTDFKQIGGKNHEKFYRKFGFGQ